MPTTRRLLLAALALVVIGASLAVSPRVMPAAAMRAIQQAESTDPPPPPPADDPPVLLESALPEHKLYFGTPALESSITGTSLDCPGCGPAKETDSPAPNGADQAEAPPINDDFNSAILINTNPFLSGGDTTGATVAGDDPVTPCASSSVPTQSNTVWYRFVAPTDGALHLDTAGSNYDTVLVVWTGLAGALTPVACSDDTAFNLTSQLDLTVIGGVTYHIEVADYGGPAGGALTFFASFQDLGRSIGWSLKADLPNDRDRLAVVSDGTYVYALGGEEFFSDYQVSSSVQRFSPADNSWTNMASLPVGYSNIDAVYVGGNFYVPAGYTGTQPYADVHYVYSVAGNSWSTAAAAPWGATTGTPNLWYALAPDQANTGYYLTGGYNGSGATNVLLRYNIGSNTWSVLAPMQTARFGHEAVLIRGKLYVAGGVDASGFVTRSTEVYDPGTNTWMYVADMNVDRVFAASAAGVRGIAPACPGGVLLVDDDNNFSDAVGGRPYYAEALEQLRVNYAVWDTVSQGKPTSADLAPFQAVVWFTGSNFSSNPFYPGGAVPMATYLDSGGRLLLSFNDYYYYSAGLTTFASNYLGIGAFGPDTSRVNVFGAAGHAVGDQLGPYLLKRPPYWPAGAPMFNDDVTAAAGATTPFRWTDNSAGSAIAKQAGAYRTLYFAWPLETMAVARDRAAVLGSSLGWLCEGDGLWYVAGGGFSSLGSYLANMEYYDPAANSWASLPGSLYSLHQARRLSSGAATGAGHFLVTGGVTADSGGDGDVLSSLHELFRPADQVIMPAVFRNFCGSADSFEPNNSFSTAYGILSNTNYLGNFGCTGDPVDVYHFTLGAPHPIDAWLTNIPSGRNFSLALYNPSKQLVMYSGNPGNANEHILTGSMSAGQYYVQVFNQGGSYGGAVTYTLRVTYQ